jgi:hypothetical protein
MRSCTRLVGDHPPAVGLVPVSCRVHPNPNDLWKDFPVIMRALEPEVMDVIWQAVEPLLPATSRSHPSDATGRACRIGCAAEGS